jgi:DNA replication protein DnaC
MGTFSEFVSSLYTKELSPQQAENLYELICERYRGGSMIVVSNRAPKDWYALFPNPVFAEGALDRLVNSARPLSGQPLC